MYSSRESLRARLLPDFCVRASRLAALLLAQILPVSSLVAPCDPGAAPRTYVTIHWDGTLVFRERRVDAIDPRQNAAGQVARVRDPLVAQQRHRLGAPASHLAVDDDVGRIGAPGDFRQTLRQVAERDQRRSRDSADLEFPRLAHIQDP